jgi:NADH-quinone oxidoreductase subunit M
MGELVKDALRGITDMTTREKAIMAPLVAMTLLLGVYPSLVTDRIGPSVAHLLENYHAAVPADAGTEVASH